MIPFRRRILVAAAKLFDLTVMIFAFCLATALVGSHNPETSLTQFLSMRIKVQNFAEFAGFLFSWHLTFCGLGVYNSHRLRACPAEAWTALKAVSLGSGVLVLSASLLRVRMVTPLFILFFWAAGVTVTLSVRVLLRSFLQRIRVRGRSLRHLLVVGTNPRAAQFAQRVTARPELGYVLVGFVDDDWPGIGEWQKKGHKLVSDLAGFVPFLKDQVVDEVVIALPMESCYGQARRIAAVCEEQGIIVRVLSDIFNMRLARTQAVEFEEQVVITLSAVPYDYWQQMLKRTLDIALSVIAMLLLAPLAALAAVLIKSTSPGPILFVQERVGFNKRKFRLYKFRTMVQGAEQKLDDIAHLNEATGPVFKMKNDPRLTPFGKFLRKISVDELPQLFNVLKGDMSLVGPRPLPLRDYQGFSENWQRRRFSVRPGITCLWQVNGRSSIPFEKWMELDMQYIDNWSFGLDLKILAMTVPAVLRREGAA